MLALLLSIINLTALRTITSNGLHNYRQRCCSRFDLLKPHYVGELIELEVENCAEHKTNKAESEIPRSAG